MKIKYYSSNYNYYTICISICFFLMIYVLPVNSEWKNFPQNTTDNQKLNILKKSRKESKVADDEEQIKKVVNFLKIEKDRMNERWGNDYMKNIKQYQKALSDYQNFETLVIKKNSKKIIYNKSKEILK